MRKQPCPFAFGLSLRHFEACERLVQIVVERFHQAERVRRPGQEQLAVRKLPVLDVVFQIPAFIFQVFSLGVALFVSNRDVFQC